MTQKRDYLPAVPMPLASWQVPSLDNWQVINNKVLAIHAKGSGKYGTCQEKQAWQVPGKIGESKMKKRIPEGDYKLWIVKAEVLCGKLEVTFQIAGNLRATISKSFALKGEGIWQLRQMLEACGITISDEVMTLYPANWIGLECMGTIVNDCGTTVISAFFRDLRYSAHTTQNETPYYVM